MFLPPKTIVLGLRKLCFCIAIAMFSHATAQSIDVQKVRIAGPFTVGQPVMIDSITLDGKAFKAEQALNAPLSFSLLKGKSLETMPQKQQQGSLNLASFTINTTAYAKVDVKTSGLKHKKVFIDGKEGASRQLTPGQYEVVVKYLADTAEVKLSVSSNRPEALSLVENTALRPFSVHDNMEMKGVSNIAISPSGRYLISAISNLDSGGKNVRKSRITDLTTGRIVAHDATGCQWMPRSDKYYKVVTENGRKHLDVTDPANGKVSRLVQDLPNESFTISPTEDYLIYYIRSEEPKRRKDVYEVVHPYDRQPNYRTRYQLGKLDFNSGLAQPITFGYHTASLHDISHDGKLVLFSITHDNITSRPVRLQSYFLLDLNTMKVREVIQREGFISAAHFYPNSTNKLVITGTPEAFNGVGRNLPEDMTPSMYDYQLYSLDLSSPKATPLTKDFNPCVNSIAVSPADNSIYFTAGNADSVSIYRMSAETGKITFVPQPVEVVNSISVAIDAPKLILSGTSAMTPARIYSLSMGKKPSIQLLEDPNADRMSELLLGECKPFIAPTSRGYAVTGHYYLPALVSLNRC